MDQISAENFLNKQRKNVHSIYFNVKGDWWVYRSFSSQKALGSQKWYSSITGVGAFVLFAVRSKKRRKQVSLIKWNSWDCQEERYGKDLKQLERTSSLLLSIYQISFLAPFPIENGSNASKKKNQSTKHKIWRNSTVWRHSLIWIWAPFQRNKTQAGKNPLPEKSIYPLKEPQG